MNAILTALRSCYGNLEDPDFRKVSAVLRTDPHRSLVTSLRESGIEITETTDPNDDASTQLVASSAGNRVALELSAVGPFAALRHLDADGRSCWVTQQDNAPTPLASLVATVVQRAGLQLLDRGTVLLKIGMRRADGTSEATLYQALFTDSDRVP